MTRLLPHPLLSALLALLWMMLTDISLGHLVLGSAIAVLAGLALARIEPDAVRVVSWRAAFRLLALVMADILRSNWEVARLLLTNGRKGSRRSGFLVIPLRLRAPVPLAMLAVILTATPGTAWLDYDEKAGTLLLHVFDLTDEEEWRVLIRDRYEALLMEAFA